MPRNYLLLVEDDALIRESIAGFFRKRGYEVVEGDSVAAAERSLRSTPPDVALVDYQLPDGDGLVLLRALRSVDPSVPVLILTAHGSIDLAVRAVKEGAEQFLTKPVELPALLVMVERLIDHRRNRQSKLVGNIRETRQATDPLHGDSPAIQRLADQARRVVSSSSPVLIQGESGTGKGLLAHWLHRSGPRAEEAFVDLNCAGLSRDLLESELFGHQKGAFTGAVNDKPGLLEIAHRGTFFLDEIGDADLQVQAKLLKVLEEQRFRRLGDVRDRQVDVRLIAASHQDLRTLVSEHRFREDLFYRISTIPLFVPPLRERGGDVAILARALLARIASELGCPGVQLKSDAERVLSGYHWPGNIRELRNVLERAVLLGDRVSVKAEDLSEILQTPVAGKAETGMSLREAERRHISRVIREEGGDIRKAAATLGLSRSALYQKMKKHGLTPSRSA